MYPAPDMSLWQGRIDSQEGADARRWHQWMRPYADDAEAASVLLGFASDEGVRRNQGRQGARHGPPALRRALANLAWHGEQAIYDAGDIVAGDDLEAAQECYAQRVADLLARGHRVVGLGGGHEIAYASFAGLARHLSRHERLPRIGILNFDAHFDLRHAERASSGTPFRQIAELCQASDWPFAYCCLGISRLSNTAALFDQAQRLGVRYLLDRQLQPWNLERSEAFLDSFLQSVRPPLPDRLPRRAPGRPGARRQRALGARRGDAGGGAPGPPRQGQRQAAPGRHRRTQPATR